jgi:hypothetical protein
MRSHLLAGFVAVLLPACLVGSGDITDVGDESGDQSGGGDTGGGDGNGGGTGEGNGGGTTATPRIQASVDKTTVSSELGKTETLMVTVQSMNGFTGPVNVNASVLDGTTALTTYTVTSTPASVTLEPGASQQIELKVKIPSDATALAPTVKVDLGGGAVSTNVSSAFTVAKQYTLVIPAGTGNTTLHAGLPSANAPLRLNAGTKLVFRNSDTITHVIHGNGGIPHENLALGAAGTDYSVTIQNDATWYCHSHEGTTQPNRPVLAQ